MAWFRWLCECGALRHGDHMTAKDKARIQLGRRIKEAREKAGISQPKLGAVAVPQPVTAQSVLKWEQGRSAPNARTLDAIAQLTGVTLKWLLYGVEDNEEAGQSEKSHVGRVVDMVDFDGVIRYLAGEKGVVKGRVRTSFPCSANSFQTMVTDDSNYPELQEGDAVIVDRDRNPRPGKFCVALHDGEPVIRRYRPREDHVELVAVNPDWPSIKVEPSEIIGAVTEISRPHG
jgi:transcriptional regulator with XRE-family HTH domain